VGKEEGGASTATASSGDGEARRRVEEVHAERVGEEEYEVLPQSR